MDAWFATTIVRQSGRLGHSLFLAPLLLEAREQREVFPKPRGEFLRLGFPCGQRKG
jgi:hypothetical protein